MKAADESDYLDFATARTGALYRSAALLSSGDPHLAEDLVQETLGRMYVHWRRVAKADNPAAYAHTVLVRVFLTHRRRRSTAEQPTGRLPEGTVGEQDATLRLTLLDALARLGPRDRAVLVLRFWEDRSVEETARALRTSNGAVRTQTSRALDRLRSVLGDALPDLARS